MAPLREDDEGITVCSAGPQACDNSPENKPTGHCRGTPGRKTVPISGSSLGASPLALRKGSAFPAEIAETLLFSAACRLRLHAAENRLYKKWRHRQGVAFPQSQRRSRRLYFIAGMVIWTTLRHGVPRREDDNWTFIPSGKPKIQGNPLENHVIPAKTGIHGTGGEPAFATATPTVIFIGRGGLHAHGYPSG